jgi:hypothetical protein
LNFSERQSLQEKELSLLIVRQAAGVCSGSGSGLHRRIKKASREALSVLFLLIEFPFHKGFKQFFIGKFEQIFGYEHVFVHSVWLPCLWT